MRTLTTCDILLNASTVTSTFEEAVVRDILPGAGDPPHPPGTLFVRSLFSAAGDGFPPAYRCIVLSNLAVGGGFFGMGNAMQLLGAEVREPRPRLLAGMLPSEVEALDALRFGHSRSLVMVTVHLPLRMIQEAFESELVAALAGEVGVATRVNNIAAAFWTRDDTVVSGRTEYLVAAIGSFMRPQLREGTLDRIRAAGGDVIESLVFHHVGTVSDDEPCVPAGEK
jgi:hypothetical protein